MPIFYLELFKTLILNFGYINSKHRKLGMFILTEIPIYQNKANSPPISQLPLFSIFKSRDMSSVHN